MAEKKTTPTADTSDREIVITRLLGAPRELVFDAWTDVRHLQHWWGPRGFSTTTHEIDVKPGGTWRFIMHGPDGVDYPNWIVYDEIVKPERLVYSHGGGKDGDDAQFKATVTFVAEGDKTRVTMRAVFPSAAEREHVVKVYGAVEGGNQHMDRMEEHVARMSSPREFVITRIFGAPRELVFKAWTESEHLTKWWGPKGFTMKTCKLDLRAGGIFHYSMRSPDGHEMWGKFVFREIIRLDRLVFINSFSDEEGKLTRHPLSPTWPLEVLSTLTFSERDGKTTVELRGVPINATEAERKTFEDGFSSMQKGFSGTMNQLADYLALQKGGGR